MAGLCSPDMGGAEVERPRRVKRLRFVSGELEDPRYTEDPGELALIRTIVAKALDEYGDMTHGEVPAAQLLLRAVSQAVREELPYSLASHAFRYDSDKLSRRPVREASGYTCTEQASAAAAVIMRAAEELGKQLYAVPVVHEWDGPDQFRLDGQPTSHVVAFVPALGCFVQPGEGVLTVGQYMAKQDQPVKFRWPEYDEGENGSTWVEFDPQRVATYREQSKWQGDKWEG